MLKKLRTGFCPVVVLFFSGFLSFILTDMTEPKTPVISYAENDPLRKKYSSATRVRLWCLLIGGLALSLLIVGWWLSPDPHGHSTHQQLGFPPCGMLTFTGIPCPTCGCTTAVSYVARGSLVKGLITQPFGAIVGYLAWIALALSIVSAIVGRWLGPSPFFFQWHVRRLLLLGGLLLAGGWVYKIMIMQWGF